MRYEQLASQFDCISAYLIISVYLQLGSTSFTTTVDEKLRGIWKEPIFYFGPMGHIERSNDSQIQPVLIGMIECQPL